MSFKTFYRNCVKTASGLNRKLRHTLPSPITESMKSVSATMDALTKKARKSVGKTDSGPFGASYATTSSNKNPTRNIVLDSLFFLKK